MDERFTLLVRDCWPIPTSLSEGYCCCLLVLDSCRELFWERLMGVACIFMVGSLFLERLLYLTRDYSSRMMGGLLFSSLSSFLGSPFSLTSLSLSFLFLSSFLKAPSIFLAPSASVHIIFHSLKKG